MMKTLRLLACILCLLAVSSISTLDKGSVALAAGGELKIGRYVGFIKLDDTGEKVALIANTLIVQPPDFTSFPKLNATFKMSLGGYGTPEYVTETFEDIRYDFNDGQLSLDEPANDLVMTAEVETSASGTRITGQVWIRSAAKSGQLYLEFESDEPGSDSDGDDGSGGTFIPSLRGQYEGHCGSERAAIQITTGKGLVEDGLERRGLHGYAITARLAFDQPEVCGDENSSASPTWCVSRNFPSGTYNFFANRLNLTSPSGSTTCSLQAGRMQCRVRMVDHTVACDLRHTNAAPQSYEVNERDFNIRTTTEQRQPLPDPLPPQHTALVQALRGQFLGYLHNEATNRYQPFRLNVIPSVSTLNPHDENRVFVSATAVTYFGRSLSGEFWPHQLERTPFYVRPGFTLESEWTDGFLQIQDWRKGYITGVWFSHAYGRVGTVQLVKDNALPALDASANVVGTIAGEFEGHLGGSSSGNPRWWFKTLFSTQPVGREQSTFRFEGDTHLSGGIIRPIRIENGAYDPYTGTLSWLTQEETPRMVIGQIDDSENLSLLWPGAAKWGIRMVDYRFAPFAKVPE